MDKQADLKQDWLRLVRLKLHWFYLKAGVLLKIKE